MTSRSLAITPTYWGFSLNTQILHKTTNGAVLLQDHSPSETTDELLGIVEVSVRELLADGFLDNWPGGSQLRVPSDFDMLRQDDRTADTPN